MPSSFLERMFAPSAAKAAGARLYEAVVAQARMPALYSRLGAPDTIEGRFELYSLHVALILLRLKGQGAEASASSQALFDHYVSGLDHGLREMGVGDLSVGKKMRKLGEAFYGRMLSCEEAVADLPDTAALAALIRRTVLAGDDAADPQPLCAYVVACRERLAAQSTNDVAAGRVAWPAP
jgi:cytochrome b pre-mRNA-processing protein 3